ncbi:MAG: T9SS type A sorting domain-containing protein [Bacteroidota bacterium]|nr:T9SS type A sorting domain-containing protein [Bacteroidota bacterium]
MKTILKTLSIAIALLLSHNNYSQLYAFTNANATSSVGPTQNQINLAYASTNLNGLVISNNGIQNFTVPLSGPYKITAIGAKGANNGGLGSQMEGVFNLIAGQVLQIVIGQKGEIGAGATNSNTGGGGGGGCFVVLGSDSLLLAAGGGGGGLLNSVGGNASTLTLAGSTNWNGGGDNGNGGYSGITNGDAAGGGGFYTNGYNSYNISQSVCEGGRAFLNGATGGESGTNGIYYGGAGGFGGGGSGWNNGINRCGGGGGYSGGQGGTLNALNIGGGGGGSYNIGSLQNNLEGVGSGNGLVIILFLKGQPLDTAPDITLGGTVTASTPTTALITTSMMEEYISSNINIYPNPSRGVFTVGTAKEFKKLNYTLITIEGKIIDQRISSEHTVQFDISELPNGVYYLKVGEGKIQKLVKN